MESLCCGLFGGYKSLQTKGGIVWERQLYEPQYC